VLKNLFNLQTSLGPTISRAVGIRIIATASTITTSAREEYN